LLLPLTLFMGGWGFGAMVKRNATERTETAYRELQLFTDVLTIVRKNYVEEVPLKDLIEGGINGMLGALDPHSSYLPPEMFREMEIDTKGEFGGLGIEITLRDGVLTIVSPIEDTPADRIGLQAGDLIVKIGDRYTKDLSIMEAVKLMRGPAGTAITISVMRESFAKPREFTLKREIIKVKSVKFRTLEKGFGYVRLAQFQEHTTDDLKAALKALRKENQDRLRGLVLDLRNNPGGLLEQAADVADLFLREGLIVYTEGRVKDSQLRYEAHRLGTEEDYPIVVLINGGSASASEIVAGALQDNGRAVILGIPSFGKGSVQTVIPLAGDAGLRLTTARYYTPRGTSIQAKGITPDILVRPMAFKEVEDGRGLREKDLANHIQEEDVDSSNRDRPSASEPSSLGEKDRQDYQLLRAIDLLKGWQLLKGLRQAA